MGDPPARDGRSEVRRKGVRALAVALLLAATVAIAGGTFLSLYDGGGTPTGFDTPWYIWRAKLVSEQGLPALARMAETAKPLPSRPGYPVLAGFFHSVAGVDPFLLALAMPALGAAVVGLGAGAFALRGLNEPRWAHILLGAAAGASVNVALTAVGHVDTLVVQGLAVAAAVTALSAAGGNPGRAATVLLVAAAALVHWPFAALFVAIVAALALLLVPGSVAGLGDHPRAELRPAARLAILVAACAAAGVVALTVAGWNLLAPTAPSGVFAARFGSDVPQYIFPVAGPLAAAGAALVLTARPPERRWSLLLAILWAASAAAASVAMLFGEVAVHRILAFALGIPLLAGAAVAAALRWLGALRPPAVASVAGAVVLVAAIAATVAAAREAWRPVTGARAEQYRQVGAAGRYVTAIGGSRPVVYVVDPGRWRPNPGVRPQFDVIRAGVPVSQFARSQVYLGTESNLLAGRPTLRPGDADFNEVSRARWPAVRGLLDDNPVVLSLDGLVRPAGRDAGGSAIAPGVRVVQGPRLRTMPAPSPSPEIWAVGAAAARVLLVLALVGSGWAAGLLDGGWVVRASMAPALGAAVLVVCGVVAGRLGLGGPSARPSMVVAAAALGWGVALTIRRQRHRRAVC
jgi:hypothetical protein